MEEYEVELNKSVVKAVDALVLYLEAQCDSRAKEIDKLGTRLVTIMYMERG